MSKIAGQPRSSRSPRSKNFLRDKHHRPAARASARRWAGRSRPILKLVLRRRDQELQARVRLRPDAKATARRRAGRLHRPESLGPARSARASVYEMGRLCVRAQRRPSADLRLPQRPDHPAAGGLARADGEAAQRRQDRPAARLRLQRRAARSRPSWPGREGRQVSFEFEPRKAKVPAGAAKKTTAKEGRGGGGPRDGGAGRSRRRTRPGCTPVRRRPTAQAAGDLRRRRASAMSRCRAQWLRERGAGRGRRRSAVLANAGVHAVHCRRCCSAPRRASTSRPCPGARWRRISRRRSRVLLAVYALSGSATRRRALRPAPSARCAPCARSRSTSATRCSSASRSRRRCSARPGWRCTWPSSACTRCSILTVTTALVELDLAHAHAAAPASRRASPPPWRRRRATR